MKKKNTTSNAVKSIIPNSGQKRTTHLHV